MRYLLAALLVLTACGGPPPDTSPASEQPDTAGVPVPDVVDTADVANAECPAAEPCPACEECEVVVAEEADPWACWYSERLQEWFCPQAAGAPYDG